MLNRNTNYEIVLVMYIICYFIISLYTLTKFPFVHSDEAWLSGLTRNMMETGNLDITETFFNLKTRFPHAIKSLFHILQMLFLFILGYNIYSFRLLSLLFACISLVLFYALLKFMFCKRDSDCKKMYPLLGTILLSLDVQFIYASHFARQEIILISCIISVIYALINNKVALAAVINGLAIGIHPNSFLIATMSFVLLIPHIFKKIGRADRLRSWKPLAVYTLITGAFAALFVVLSLFFDKGFIKHYLQYGKSEFDIGAPLSNKLAEVPYFLTKIWYGISGTYYVPNIKLEFVLFVIAIILGFILIALNNKNNREEVIFVLKGLIGIVAGMIIIGRYNQTSIIFIFPLLFLLILLVIDSGFSILAPKSAWLQNSTIIILTFCLAVSSYMNIKPWMAFSYEDYTGEISKVVEPGDKVLANLNCEYYFDNGKLLDYRNLAFLKENNKTVAEYIEENDIKYIILSDELDFIYSQRPVWNMIYGNIRYMEELNVYTKEKCILIDSFVNNTYGVRIVQYMNSDRSFTVKIFKVKDFT